ncbi:MAG: hypothetical protein ACO36I_12340 [Candidatus Latescibacterota bacterium]|jgi:hypothetical protein
MHSVKLYLTRSLMCLLMISVTALVAEAKNKRLNNDLVETVTALAKDREDAFSGREAMTLEEFKTKWTAVIAALNEEYEGHTVKLKTFGTDVAARKGFSHLIYMALRVQQGTQLEPQIQDVISKHPFMQELTIEGACYTGGDAFPKKMKDLLKAYPEMQGAIRAKLDAWDNQYRKKFEKEFGNAG